MRVLWSLIFVLMVTGSAAAQQTKITATITDSHAQIYAGGSGTARIVCPGNAQPYIGNSPLNRNVSLPNLDSFGSFTTTVYDVNFITTGPGTNPGTCSYQFTFTDACGVASFTTSTLGGISQSPVITGAGPVNLTAAIQPFVAPVSAACTVPSTGDVHSTLPNTFSATNTFNASVLLNSSVTVSGLTPGNCVQATTGGLLTSLPCTPPAVTVAAESLGASPSAGPSTNATAIQSALTTGGLVSISGSGAYSYNSPLVINSQTTLRLAPSVQLGLTTNTNNNMIVNHAFTQRGFLGGTFTYSSGVSSCTNGTQQVSFTNGSGEGGTGNIVVSGGLPTGNVTITNPGSYYLSPPTQGTIATCTGTATFTGGTATGSLTSVTLTWTTGTTEVSVAWPSHGFVAGVSYVAIWGSGLIGSRTTSAFAGVFPVESVTDSGHFTYRTFRLPASAPTGTVVGLQADINITIDGGVWNYGSQTSVNNPFADPMEIFACANCAIRNVAIVGANGNGVYDAMTNGFFVENFLYQGKLQAIKSVGPAVNARVTKLTSYGQDDVVTWMNSDLPPFNSVILSSGDVMNVEASNIQAYVFGPATGVVVAYFDANQYMGAVHVHDIGGVSNPANTLACGAVSGIQAGAILDTYQAENLNCATTWSFATGTGNASAYNINSLDLHGITCNQQNNSSSIGDICIQVDSFATIQRFTIDGMNVGNSNNTGGALQYIQMNGVVKEFNITNATLKSSGSQAGCGNAGSPGRLLELSNSSNVQQLNISNAQIPCGDVMVHYAAGNPNTLRATISSSNISALTGIEVNSNGEFTFIGNQLNTLTAVVNVNTASLTSVYIKLVNNYINVGGAGVILAVTQNPTNPIYLVATNNHIDPASQGWVSNSFGVGKVLFYPHDNAGFFGALGNLTLANTECLVGYTPSLGAGWGTGAGILHASNFCNFIVQTGTAATGATGTLNFPLSAPNGWTCVAFTQNVAGFLTVTPATSTSSTVASFSSTWTSNAALPFSDQINFSCGVF